MHKITLIKGDGIGPEITDATIQVIEATGVQIDWEEVPVGENAVEKYHTPLPEVALESILRNKVALKGPTTTPFGGDYSVEITWGGNGKKGVRKYPSISVALRNELDLYCNVREIKNYPGVESKYQNIDIVFFRENTEDLYAGKEHMVVDGVAESLKIITEKATRRVAKFAAEYAVKNNRKTLTVVHKANIMKKTDGLFLEVAQDEIGKYPSLEVNDRVVDNMCMQLVQKPEQYDCLVLPNLYGDVLSDLGAGLIGGLGVAPGANIGDNAAEFEAIHGSAPKYTGLNRANPMALLLSGVMMLKHIGEVEAAQKIEKALTIVLQDKSKITVDLGGTAGTKEMGQAIAEVVATL